jgi:hypothetical protein
MAVLGLFNPIGIVLGLPEMEDAAMEKYPKDQTKRINYLCAGIFNTFLGFG